VDGIEAGAYRIPTDQPEADGTLAWDHTDVVVVRASAGSVVGTGWTYGSGACVEVIRSVLAEQVHGLDVLDVAAAHERMLRAVRNLGGRGLVAMAVSAVDIALWDLKARVLGAPLCGLLGRVQPSIPVYGSGGFTTYDSSTTARQLEHWVGTDGVGAVKIKVGESWGTEWRRDLERVALARKVIGADVELFVDANGGYSVGQAARVGREMVEGSGVVWFEEPVSSDDLDGLGQLRGRLACDVAAGEYGFDLAYFERMLTAGAVDCLQIDVTRCGGYTTWLGVAALAAARNLQVSGHCAPSLHAQVAVAVPNARHIEYFHDHCRADAMLFDGVLDARDGVLTPDPDRPGHGMTLKVPDAEAFRLR
jgi:L-alanine-DL-glutamate epimerase-like enolase superfamily enzyme